MVFFAHSWRRSVIFQYFLLFFTVEVLSNERFYGIAYSPYRQYGSCPAQHEIWQDHHIARAHTSRIRLYSTECHELNDIVLEAATHNDVEVLLGLWIDGNPARDQQEAEDLYKYIRRYPNAKLLGIAVGNEVLYRGTMAPEHLASMVHMVKLRVRQIGQQLNSHRLLTVPIFSVDVIPHPLVVQQSDAIGVNVHPFYRTDLNKYLPPPQMADAALQASIQQITQLQNLYQGKEVFVTETGWPTSSAPTEYHIGNQEVSVRYRQKFSAWGDSVGLKYFLFELVDSPWKYYDYPNEPQTMSEFHWGIGGVAGEALGRTVLGDRLSEAGDVTDPWASQDLKYSRRLQ